MAKQKAVSARGGRNTKVEAAVVGAIARVDAFVSGATVRLPSAAYRRACDALLSESPSVRTTGLFLAFYALQDSAWDYATVPKGMRGKHGDKWLCEQLSRRDVTLHGTTKAYGENLGFKGNVSSGPIDLSLDRRFKVFVKGVGGAAPEQRVRIADYLAERFAESRRVTTPLPPVGADVLTFARARALFHALAATPSKGHIQQFLVAALLREHRKRHGITVTTHHPHAADTYDRTAGDIEERVNGDLVGAYEVTVRPDWQNRLSGFKAKMDEYGLRKYIIIASGVNADPAWSEPASMLAKLEPYGRDIAVVDLSDVVNVFTAELTVDELRAVVNGTYLDLCNPKLSNRDDFKTAYRAVVSAWLDEAASEVAP